MLFLIVDEKFHKTDILKISKATLIIVNTSSFIYKLISL